VEWKIALVPLRQKAKKEDGRDKIRARELALST
jgi:hypothetical protein